MKLGRELRGMSRHMAVGFQMVALTAIGAMVGWWLDKKTGRAPIFLAVCFLLGAAGGIAAVWYSMKDPPTGPKQ